MASGAVWSELMKAKVRPQVDIPGSASYPYAYPGFADDLQQMALDIQRAGQAMRTAMESVGQIVIRPIGLSSLTPPISGG
jgi:hypothetical protein